MEPKKIAIICLCFLLSLFLTQSPELAVVVSIAVSILLFKIPGTQILKFTGILTLTFLLYPLLGEYIAVVVGYGIFIYIFDKLNEDRYAFGISLLFLVFCPLLLVIGKSESAETLAIFAYLFLIVGSVQKIILLMKKPSLIKPFSPR